MVETQKNCITVLLVDDHPLLLDALKTLIKSTPDLSVAGVARSVADALRLIASERPQVVIMDIELPDGFCFDILERAGTPRGDMHAIIFSAHQDDRFIEQALKCGVRGYISKQESMESIREAIHTVAHGGVFFSDDIKSRLVVENDTYRLSERAKTLLNALTGREIAVLRLLARGLSKKQVARELKLSVKTISTHTENIMVKTNIHDRVELSRLAIRERLILP